MKKIRDAGKPLGEYVNGEIYRGVLTGLNEAFVIDKATKKRLIAEDPKSAEIIKPFLAGRDIKRYETPKANSFLIFTRRGIEIDKYPAIKAYLEQYKERLMPKPANFKGKWQGRKPGKYAWYEIQDTVAYWEKFEEPKIIYAEISQSGNFALDYAAQYSDTTTYILPVASKPLLGVLNSKLFAFIFSNISSEIRGGFFRWKRQYMEKMPLPKNIESAKELSDFVDSIAKKTQKFKIQQQKFLKRLQTNFDLDKLSKKLETFYEHNFKTLMKELKKKKVTLSLKEQDEWEEYFESYRNELLELKAEIDKTDQEIDEMVYALYEFSEEEIAVVEAYL